MKRMPAFLLICIFAVIFIFSFLYPPENRYGKTLNVIGQAGLALSLLLFFLLPGKKNPPKERQDE